ncbi:MAG: phosphodiesterase [Candidatus Schekmanbacteria bacterium RBG_13_48_7]|uniref:Phosphodiesterase n=1 Tax=Candidatus Schekmanbacteria bacterium RBG_13_48_7 TaxID=1817878 RepID=A0A1F7RM82_9BACT|nr:MAG: phosphodiesterase [Candidatus Schekmanbacteria bacterium RBG_13_48_7]
MRNTLNRRKQVMNKLLIIGLDCATPQLVFDAWWDDLPNMKKLGTVGGYGKLRSTVPPITVPAWTSMMTSKDPGMLGFYGFRNRSSYGYEDLYFANANYLKEKTVWNYLSRNRLSSIIFGVPQTYPPRPLNGMMVASFLTPSKEVQYTYPQEVALELDQVADGDYIIDVEDFRTDEKDKLLKSIYVMTERRFKAFRHFYQKDDYDFGMMVEMGIDRIHHGFWRYCDKTHRLYEPGNPYEDAIYEYYKYIDSEIGKTLDILDRGTSMMIVSDHGAKGMTGAICINEWLQKEGYLTLKSQPSEPKKLKTNMIDWGKTMAWGEGGYYSRIFMNVEGREPLGIIPRSEYEKHRDDLRDKLESMVDEDGKKIGTKAFKPEDIYRTCNNIPPDLVVYLGNLDWRSAGSVGTGTLYLYENDTGPDDANHAEHGIFIWDHSGLSILKSEQEYSIYDIAPSILSYFGLDVPGDMIGTSLLKR